MKLDIFRALIIAQPFLWIWIIEDDRFNFLNREEYVFSFPIISIVFILIVYLFEVDIGFYTNELLTLYSLMVLITSLKLLLDFDYSPRKAIATSFLIVYLNSWFWESFLHIWVILENGFSWNQLFQTLHLIPAFYFLIRYRFDVSEAIHRLWNGFLASTLISYIRILRLWRYLPIAHTTQTVDFFNHGLMILNRLICLYFLFNVIIVWGMHKVDYRKLMRQTKVLYT